MGKITIGQGDALRLRCPVTKDGEEILIDNIEKVEFSFNENNPIIKTYPGEVTYDDEDKVFEVPLTQEETFSFPGNSAIAADCRVKFIGDNNVRKCRRWIYVTVNESISKEVL